VHSRPLLLALTLVLVPSIANADSDGYFCAAPGILAFDTMRGGALGRTINIVRFDRFSGIQPREQIEISDDIQTHAMTCTPRQIEVYSGDQVYTIDISLVGAPKLAAKRAAQVPPGTTPNLAHWAREPRIFVLQTVGDDERFELVVARARAFTKGKGGVTYTSTDLVHRVGMEIRAQQRLFFGVFPETVD
jgi:hypothetical protein